MVEWSLAMALNSNKLSLWSGIGLCIASMIGSGIFLSSGYMAQEMSPAAILAAWAVGAALAMLGVATYAELARQIPRSGGEYRYIRELLSPALAYVAGWITLIIGFAQPTAINALAAATFLSTIVPIAHAKLFAGAAIVILSLGHAYGQASSKWLQNVLVIAKIALLLGFVALGLVAGNHGWPTWQPPTGSTSIGAFVGSLFYVSYAFSGWNMTAYVSERFDNPKRDVGRSMFFGCLLVASFYMLVNWIFVANLDPAQASVVMQSGQATLGHAVTEQLAGATGARFMSVLAVMTFLSAMSAMLMIGPHIAATMAEDGALPSVFLAKPGKPPKVALLFQTVVALLVLTLQSLKGALASVGATLILFSALAAISLLVAHFRNTLPTPAKVGSLVSAFLYALFSSWLLYFAFRDQAQLLPFLATIVLLALVAYWISRTRSAD